jgi:hypothetical protein
VEGEELQQDILMCEKILYAVEERDLTEDEKAGVIASERTKKIIVDWCNPSDWTPANRDWFYNVLKKE